MQRIVRWGMAVPLALYFGLAYQPRPAQAQVSVAKTRLALNDPVLKGRNIGSLGIRRNAGAPPIKGPSLVLIGSSTCEACRWALRWASTQSFAPLVKVSNVAGGEVTDEEGYVFDAPNSGIASPSLLLIDGSGTIIDEEYGWAESTIFKKALEERFARALAGAKTESRRTKS